MRQSSALLWVLLAFTIWNNDQSSGSIVQNDTTGGASRADRLVEGGGCGRRINVISSVSHQTQAIQ